jgi:hypothetical protein
MFHAIHRWHETADARHTDTGHTGIVNGPLRRGSSFPAMVAALGWRGDGGRVRRKSGGLHHQGDRGEVKAIAGGSDAYEAAGSQGRRMTEERRWKSFGRTARFVAEPL